MKRNDTYLSPGRSASPAELELDSDSTECLRCGEWAGICICEGGPHLEDEGDDADTLEALREDRDDARRETRKEDAAIERETEKRRDV